MANLTSYVGTVTLVPLSGALVGSDFLMGAESWTIVGNKATAGYAATFEPYSRGPQLNYYIIGTDDLIYTTTDSGPGPTDRSLWYFVAPSKFYGNYGISYGGTLSFALGAFSGDFTKLNEPNVCIVLLCLLQMMKSLF